MLWSSVVASLVRVIGNGYGVVLPASYLIVEMCFQCVSLC